MKNRDYLIVGPFAKDLNHQGFSIGGSAYYSGITAKKLGSKVKILASFSSDIEKEKDLKEFDIFRIPSLTTTTFENIYQKGERRQYLHQTASYIYSKHLPGDWRSCPIVQLAPLAREVDENIVFSFPDSLIGASLQGWLRKGDKNKLVVFNLWKNYKKFLPKIDVAFLSEEDVRGDLDLVKELAKYSDILVLTQGKKGCKVYHQNKTKHFKARKIKETHPTGAGDVFAAAFLINFQKTRNLESSAEFANFIASSFVEKGSVEKLKI